jgi:predicted nucleotide-binding protein (sugar kinase/HSP70/actin superfamily)
MGREYGEKRIKEALLGVVALNGNVAATAKRMHIPAGTLRKWVTETHSDLYHQLQQEHAQELEEQLVANAREIAIDAAEATRLAVESARAKIEDGKEEDPSRAAANLSRVMQTNTDKMLALTGRPSSYQGQMNMEATLRALAEKGIIKVPNLEQGAIEGSAEETEGGG